MTLSLCDFVAGPDIFSVNKQLSDEMLGLGPVCDQNLGAKVCIFGCRHLRLWDGIHSTFFMNLDFPDYFGANKAALVDMLTDFEWLEAFWVVLFFRYSSFLLRAERKNERDIFVDILSDSAAYWKGNFHKGRKFVVKAALLDVDAECLALPAPYNTLR